MISNQSQRKKKPKNKKTSEQVTLTHITLKAGLLTSIIDQKIQRFILATWLGNVNNVYPAYSEEILYSVISR